jgi:hypothetical protein
MRNARAGLQNRNFELLLLDPVFPDVTKSGFAGIPSGPLLYRDRCGRRAAVMELE